MTSNEPLVERVAVVTDDGMTISAHFGRARYYLVVTIEGGTITGREMRPKASHHDFVHAENEAEDHEHGHNHDDDHGHGSGHGHGAGAQNRHERMFSTITDCSVVLARGMGMGAYQGLQEAGIRPLVTAVSDLEEALSRYIAGRLEDHPERLH